MATIIRLARTGQRPAATAVRIMTSGRVDEADHMADLGFLPVVRRLLDATPPQGQRMLFSATLDRAVDVLIGRFLHHPAEHAVDPPGAPAPIVHHLLTVAPADQMAVLAADAT